MELFGGFTDYRQGKEKSLGKRVHSWVDKHPRAAKFIARPKFNFSLGGNSRHQYASTGFTTPIKRKREDPDSAPMGKKSRQSLPGNSMSVPANPLAYPMYMRSRRPLRRRRFKRRKMSFMRRSRKGFRKPSRRGRQMRRRSRPTNPINKSN